MFITPLLHGEEAHFEAASCNYCKMLADQTIQDGLGNTAAGMLLVIDLIAAVGRIHAALTPVYRST